MHYASHQNGSLATEYAPLWADVERSLPWADASLGGLPAATNFWMGEEMARTTVHADLFDNVYAVVRGRKQFALLPPQEGHRLRRQEYRAATYTPAADCNNHADDDGTRGASDAPADDATESSAAAAAAGLRIAFDEPAASVLWSPVDLEDASSMRELRPLIASVGPGEVLFLPALWWHAVSQKNGADGECCVAVNYWYDTAMG